MTMRDWQTLIADNIVWELAYAPSLSHPGLLVGLAKGGLKAKTSARRGHLQAHSHTLAQLALRLSEVLHRPVLDATEVTGKFDFKLESTPDDMTAKPLRGSASDVDATPSFFAAL